MARLNNGYTTGSCAAAAAKAAVLLLTGVDAGAEVEIPLPAGGRLRLPLSFARRCEGAAEAGVRKDGGDDPDVTTGLTVVCRVEWLAANEAIYAGPEDEKMRMDSSAQTDNINSENRNFGIEKIKFVGGEGVGRVTLPGLSVAVGEPAINPGPRRMIAAAIGEVSARACQVTVSIPGGEEMAQKTFNPRLGIVGGLSVLGTSGIVRAFSLEAMRDALLCGLDVAIASGIDDPILVPGNIGQRAAEKYLKPRPQQIVEAGNDWGAMIDHARTKGLQRLAIIGHPGKLAKLWIGDWDTHSSRSRSPVAPVQQLAKQMFDVKLGELPTVEGVLMALTPEKRKSFSCALAEKIGRAVEERLAATGGVAVMLVNMAGDWQGAWGEIERWQ